MPFRPRPSRWLVGCGALFAFAAAPAHAQSSAVGAPVSLPCIQVPQIGLTAGDRVLDNGIAVAVPPRGTRVWEEEVFPTGPEELMLSRTTSGMLQVAGCGSERSGLEGLLTGTGSGSPEAVASRAGGGTGGDRPCSDDAHAFYPWEWTRRFDWRFDAATTPGRLPHRRAQRVLRKATRAITRGRTSCHLPDDIDARQSYRGKTRRRPDFTGGKAPGCRPWDQTDGHSVVDFGRLDAGALARTCTWSLDSAAKTLDGVPIGTALESDTRFGRAVRWTLRPRHRPCGRRFSLGAVATHERGHTFGLAHVAEAEHGALTMSPLLNGACEASETTLGRGDWLGLADLY